MTDSTNTVLDLSRWGPSIRAYAKWLAAEDPEEAREWEHRINLKAAQHVEGAVAEAVAWDYLINRVGEIHRFRVTETGVKRPDFACRSGDLEFVVEVMNLSRDRVTRRTGLNDPMVPGEGPKDYQPWDRELKNVLTKKATQGKGLTTPYVVFVTTLHEEASAVLCAKSHTEMILHSRSHLRGFIDEQGAPVGDVQVVTDMATAAFTRKNSIDTARQHVSAMLVGGFGTYPDIRVHGLIHPEALHPLSPDVIRDTPFCSWRRWPPGPTVEITWSDEGASSASEEH